MSPTKSKPSKKNELLLDGLPQLRADRSGYVLDGKSIDGFADEPGLADEARRRIARWANAFAASDVTASQLDLLDSSPDEPPAAHRELVLAAIRDAEEDLPQTVDFGLYDRLSPEQIRRVREPWTVLPNREYPLGVHELAVLCEATDRQIRIWESQGLLPAHRINAQRQFFEAAAVSACALREMAPFEIAALAKVRRGADDDLGFIQLLSAALARTVESAEDRTAWAEDALQKTLSSLYARLSTLIRETTDEIEPEEHAAENVHDDETRHVAALGLRSLDDDATLLVRPCKTGKLRHWVVHGPGLQLASEPTKNEAVRVAKAVLQQGSGGTLKIYPIRPQGSPKTMIVGKALQRPADAWITESTRVSGSSRSGARGPSSHRSKAATSRRRASRAGRAER